MMVEFKNKE